jgi:PAT family beta-lactamase induction signal transducer AmpG
MAKAAGWESFFVFCALIAIPGMLLLLKFGPGYDAETERSSAG